jgi:hypothetical protein
MFGNKSIVLAGLALTVLCNVLIAAPARAQDDVPDVSIRCVDLRRIDRTEIVGDRTILFHMTDRTIYQNQLPHACPGLLRGEPFMYRVTLMQLCDSDVVTVLERWGFGGLTPMESCLLGAFSPIDPAAADALRAAAKARERQPRR